MILKSTKEEQKQKLNLRIENALKTSTITYPQGRKLHVIWFIPEELEIIKEICNEKGLEFGESARGKVLTLPPTYEGYIIT